MGVKASKRLRHNRSSLWASGGGRRVAPGTCFFTVASEYLRVTFLNPSLNSGPAIISKALVVVLFQVTVNRTVSTRRSIPEPARGQWYRQPERWRRLPAMDGEQGPFYESFHLQSAEVTLQQRAGALLITRRSSNG